MKGKQREYYSKINWSVKQVHEMKPEWTPKQCREFLKTNETELSNLVRQKGNEFLTAKMG